MDMLNSRVLFVADGFMCNLSSCDFLQENEFDTLTTYFASSDFAVIGKHEDLSGLVTDIDLGPGADGFEVARRIRAAYPDIAVVHISGMGRERFTAEGVRGSKFVAKPFRPSQITEALGRATQ
jgi:FixJ family two-component response regulator